jgi:hypothetical protein
VAAQIGGHLHRTSPHGWRVPLGRTIALEKCDRHDQIAGIGAFVAKRKPASTV